MWWFTAAALAQAAPTPPEPPPAPAPPPAAPAPEAASTMPDAPPWFKADCDVAVSLDADGKVAVPPASGACDWTGKPKVTLPKEGAAPTAPCHLYFKASSGFIMGDVYADKTCPKAWAASAKGFVLAHTWSDGEYHVAVTFAQ